ncbi:hypothetical protein ACFXDH_18665 [Streptomyces sp. NPDC059467]|uniref:hypothetical protein n=1 Tax=Streptomyces sp. NPDC059467 TaxID=3346844 RepID=UPI0036B8633C
MSDTAVLRARWAVRRAARHLAEDAPRLAAGSAGSAGAYQVGLASRTADLRRAALTAWLFGVPEHVVAADGRVPVTVVHEWIEAAFSPGRSGSARP